MLIQWIIIALLLLIGFWYIKVEHHTHKIKITILIILVAIIYFSMVGVFSSTKVDLTSPSGVVNAVYVYFGWMGQTITNLWEVGTDTTRTVGNAIRLNGSDNNNPSNRIIGRR